MTDTDRSLHDEFLASLPERTEELARLWQPIEDRAAGPEETEAFFALVEEFRKASEMFGRVALADHLEGVHLRLRQGLGRGFLSAAEAAELGRLIAATADRAATGDRPRPVAVPFAREPIQLVYLVEPDLDLARLLVGRLRESGYTVVALEAPEDLTDALERACPRAVVVDILTVQGAAGGLAAVERVRSKEPGLPVVFLTTQSDLETRLAALRAGAGVHFTRSTDVEGLVETLEIVTGELTGGPFRVLIVEDDEAQARYSSIVLGESGMEVEVVSRPRAVLPRIAGFRPDVVLLDYHLPGCTGAELAALVRQEAGGHGLPLVFLSADDRVESQLRALRMGGDAFLGKPVDAACLVETVRSRARRRRVLRSGHRRARERKQDTGAIVRSLRSDSTRRRRAEHLDDLRTARERQEHLLPDLPSIEGLRLDVLYQPLGEVGGDFYDVFALGPRKLGVVVADVTGHGVAAALLMSMCKKVFQMVSRLTDSPVRALSLVNEEVLGDLDSGTFFTALYAILDLDADVLRFARAGHEALLLTNPDRPEAAIAFRPPGIAVGLASTDRFESEIEEVSIPLMAGDLFVLFTDGLTEAESPERVQLGRDRLIEILGQGATPDPPAVLRRLRQAMIEHRTDERLDDDLTILALQRV